MSETAQRKMIGESPVSDISIHGIIKASLYEEIKKYLIPPSVKIMWIVMIAVEVILTGYGVVIEHAWINAVLLAALLALMLFLYRRMKNNIVKNVYKQHPAIKQEGYHVLITFGPEIRLLNHTTGVERTLEYKSIYSVVRTEHVLLCFATKDRRRRYMLIPTGEATAEQLEKIMEKITAKAGKLKKRW